MAAGFNEVIVGAGLVTVNTMGVEAPPPGVGLVTTIGNVPAAPVNWPES